MLLDEIARATRRRVEIEKGKCPQKDLEVQAAKAPPPRDFLGTLNDRDFALIAEIKRASPSAGLLAPGLQARALAAAYARGGAAAISVLTEPQFFQGGWEDLEAVRSSSWLPVLAKDFFLDPYQLYLARSRGADAVLLIVRLLPSRELTSLLGLARALGLASLVEVHNEKELETALSAGVDLLGINNRDLDTFQVSMETTWRLLPRVPSGVLVVSESGIKTPQDIAALKKAGVRACLVGEALVTSPDPEKELRGLLGGQG